MLHVHRAASLMYDDSEGTVLLLAAVDHREPASSPAALSRQERLHRTLANTGAGTGPGTLRAAPAAACSSSSSARGVRAGAGKRRKAAEEAYAHVQVFPDDDFRFTIDCHLLVLAETQAAAEDLIFNFQVDTI